MPISSLDDIWAVVSEECKKLITETAFNCFLKDLKPVSFSGGEFVLSCNDEYARGIIEQNYSKVLETALKTCMELILKPRLFSKTMKQKY